MRAGDTLVAVQLDRVGRSLKHIVKLVDDLSERKVNLRTLRGLSIDTTTAASG
jgi:DNA invertase Pin-like site-specific DNA recombinase